MGRRMNFLISLSGILQNKIIMRMLESEIVRLALPWRGMISLLIKEAVAGIYDGGRQW